jgi:hypothetical protein
MEIIFDHAKDAWFYAERMRETHRVCIYRMGEQAKWTVYSHPLEIKHGA